MLLAACVNKGGAEGVYSCQEAEKTKGGVSRELSFPRRPSGTSALKSTHLEFIFHVHIRLRFYRIVYGWWRGICRQHDVCVGVTHSVERTRMGVRARCAGGGATQILVSGRGGHGRTLGFHQLWLVFFGFPEHTMSTSRHSFASIYADSASLLKRTPRCFFPAERDTSLGVFARNFASCGDGFTGLHRLQGFFKQIAPPLRLLLVCTSAGVAANRKTLVDASLSPPH